MKIITRDEWGARPPKHRNQIDTPTPELYLHHFASAGWLGAAGMRRCQDFHMDSRGWSDIAYSFCIDPRNGTVYEGRGAGISGGHTRGRNTVSHAICFQGDTDKTPPSKAAIESAARLAAHGQREGWWREWTGGHRDAPNASTACPGRYAYAALDDIKALTALYLNEADDTKVDDMPPVALVILTYNAILGRNPESLETIQHWVKVIESDGDRGTQFVFRIADSAEAKARRAAMSDALSRDGYEPCSDEKIIATITEALND